MKLDKTEPRDLSNETPLQATLQSWKSDLSSITLPQLLVLAEQALAPAA